MLCEPLSTNHFTVSQYLRSRFLGPSRPIRLEAKVGKANLAQPAVLQALR